MKGRRPGLVYGFASVMLSFLVLCSTLWYGFGGDQAWFSYCAWVWRKFGQVPYVDVFEQNFPGIFIIHYFVQAVLGEGVSAFRFFDLAWQTATAFLLYLAAGRIFANRLSGLLAAVLYSLYYVNLGLWHTGERDGFLLLLYVSSFLLLFRREPAEAGIFDVVPSGLLLGVGFIIKPIAVFEWLVLAALIWKSSQAKFSSLLGYGFGLVLPFAACILYYWHLGGLDEFFTCLFSFNFKVYLDYGLSGFRGLLKGMLMIDYLRANLLLWLGGVLVVPFLSKLSAAGRKLGFWGLLLLAGAYSGYLFQGKYGYHFYYHEAPVWGMLCIFAGGGWSLAIRFLAARWDSRRIIPSTLFSLALMICGLLLFRPEVKDYFSRALRSSPNTGRHQSPYYHNIWEIAGYVRSRTRPKDGVQVWGGETGINYFSRRRAHSRFPNTLHLVPFRPGQELLSPLQRRLGEEFLADLKKNPPVYFIISTLPYFNQSSCKNALVQDYAEVWDFVRSRYFLEKDWAGSVEIWRLRD